MDNSTDIMKLNTTKYYDRESDPNNNDVQVLASNYLAYKIADGIYLWYFAIMIPAGILGNILSFLVMIQKHNRHMSFSIYICVLSIFDTVTLTLGLVQYLSTGYNVDIPPNQLTYCAWSTTIVAVSSHTSIYLIVIMTFERFYSILRPHKAASFNTIKRAKITISCIIFVNIVYSLPHLFITSASGRTCVFFLKGMKYLS